MSQREYSIANSQWTTLGTFWES